MRAARDGQINREHRKAARDRQMNREHRRAARDGQINREHMRAARDGHINREHRRAASDGQINREHRTAARDGQINNPMKLLLFLRHFHLQLAQRTDVTDPESFSAQSHKRHYVELYDACETGECKCAYGYKSYTGKCRRWKKIGESCDPSTETCYTGSCISKVCTCDDDKPASYDKMFCGRMAGENCTKRSDCSGFLVCNKYIQKCLCGTYSTSYYITGDYGIHHDSCVPDGVNTRAKEGEWCERNTLRVCKHGLRCRHCPNENPYLPPSCLSGPKAWPNGTVTSKWDNGNSCDSSLKGASQLSVSLLALGGLLVTAVLTKSF
ncbi:hypothetical protein LSAT2_015352 [Lamellibrachia satsuma]|nr:hypothetical protein LSAT2_015352 [Lamellibrachia satsuma]